MRARNIKPDFFKNPELAELPAEVQLLFAGLWMMADREGRLEDRPNKIKGEIFPFKDVDVDAGLSQLFHSPEQFIIRYQVAGKNYIQITNFTEHQNPHRNEKPSEIPAFSSNSASAPEKDSTAPADTGYLIPECGNLIPDSLNPENLNTETPTPEKGGGGGRFFKINLRGQEMTEDEWIFRCLLERRRSKKQSIQGCDNLQALLSLYPTYMDHYRRWVLKPMEVRMAAFVFMALHGKADDQLRYATTAAEDGQEWEKMPAYRVRAKELVDSGDLEIVING